MFANMTNALDFQAKALVVRADRQRVIASNIANADTPGYAGRDINFKEAIPACGTPLYTDARLFCEHGIPAVLYGCGPRTVSESNAKRADENLDLADLRRATKVIARSLLDLLSKG